MSMKLLVDCCVLLFLSLTIPSSTAGPSPPYNLQCNNYLVGLSQEQLRDDAIFIRYHATDDPYPTLSWSIRHTEKGAYQSAFRLQVSRGRNDFTNIIWDTGALESRKQTVMYQGPNLIQGEIYFWKVVWWDHNGVATRSEEIGHFLSAVFVTWDTVNWIASSIGITNAQTFVKKVDLTGKSVERAILYISGLGFYRAYVNGHDLLQLSDPPVFFVPGWSNYQFRVEYQVFSITELVKENLQTVLKVVLAKGYRDTSEFEVHDKGTIPDAVECVLRAQLKIEFSDGTDPLIIRSDESWDVYTSKFLQATIFGGELYNALIQEAMVAKASLTEGPSGDMILSNSPDIVETGYDSPIDIYYLKNNASVQIVDFGTNTAGVVNISVGDVPAGQQIDIKHAEVLLHPPYGERNGSLYVDNLRSAEQLDRYISDGVAVYYRPSFTYHGFRYISVANYPRKLTVKDLTRIRISSNLKRNSKFTTSNMLLNQLQENVVISHVSNLMSIPTDCDQRDERLGWMGDAALSTDAMALNFHMETYFPHRVSIIHDDQINGSIPEITPFYKYGMRPAESSWAADYVQTVWVLFEQYGDSWTAIRYFPYLYEYIMFMEKGISKRGIAWLTGRNGDWCQPVECEKSSNNFTSGFSLMLNIKQMVKMGEEIHDKFYTSNLSSLFVNHTREFNDAYFDSTASIYGHDLQIDYALPKYLDIVPLENSLLSAVRLVNKVTDEFNFHLSTGIVGTKAILPVLTREHLNGVAIETVTSVAYPSYGFMIHNPHEPATALWELWNSHNGSASMDSRNHHMFSSVSGWMQTDMIGFQQVKDTYGYEEIDLYPASSPDLSAASIELDYPKPVKYSWHRKGGLHCGKAAEDQSSLNPGLPKHDGLIISCGEGVVSEVVFASYGNPVGVCGYHRYGDCHSTNSMDIVEKLCMNKSECKVQTDGDFWGDPCPGNVEVKWLTVAVQCTAPTSNKGVLNRYSSLSVDVSVPIGSTAHVNIPAYGLGNLTVWDSDQLVYSDNSLQPSKGILSASWIQERDLLKLDLMSGDYFFTARGQAPNETQTIVVNGDKDYAVFKCTNDRHVISRFDWISYGNPVRDSLGNPTLGEYHSHASQMIVEDHCLGKNSCSVPMDKDLFFAGSPNQSLDISWNLVATFSCNYHG